MVKAIAEEYKSKVDQKQVVRPPPIQYKTSFLRQVRYSSLSIVNPTEPN